MPSRYRTIVIILSGLNKTKPARNEVVSLNVTEGFSQSAACRPQTPQLQLHVRPPVSETRSAEA